MYRLSINPDNSFSRYIIFFAMFYIYILYRKKIIHTIFTWIKQLVKFIMREIKRRGKNRKQFARHSRLVFALRYFSHDGMVEWSIVYGKNKNI